MKMKATNYLLKYTEIAPLQLAIIRSNEVYHTSKIKMRKPILDIGCSDGIFAHVLFSGKKNSIDVGIDFDELALKLSKDKKVYKKTIFADARNLPFKDSQFYTVFSNQSLEHVDGVEKAIKEISRVLKKEGKFIFLVPTIFLDEYWITSSLFKSIGLTKLSKFLHDKRNKLFKHYNLWPIKKWENLLRKNGLIIENYCYMEGKKRYFLSEMFQIFRLPQYLLRYMLKKDVLFPRKPALFMAKIISLFLAEKNSNTSKEGPTMLIVAYKK